MSKWAVRVYNGNSRGGGEGWGYAEIVEAVSLRAACRAHVAPWHPNCFGDVEEDFDGWNRHRYVLARFQRIRVPDGGDGKAQERVLDARPKDGDEDILVRLDVDEWEAEHPGK